MRSRRVCERRLGAGSRQGGQVAVNCWATGGWKQDLSFNLSHGPLQTGTSPAPTSLTLETPGLPLPFGSVNSYALQLQHKIALDEWKGLLTQNLLHCPPSYATKDALTVYSTPPLLMSSSRCRSALRYSGWAKTTVSHTEVRVFCESPTTEKTENLSAQVN